MDVGAPGLRVELVEPPPALVPVSVDVPAFVCVCERGPLDTPVRLGSWSAFRAVFGGFMPAGLGAYAVKAFFDQGGDVCWVVRVAAPEVTTSTVGPQPADRTRSVVASAAGIVVGAAATVLQAGATHTYLVTAIEPGPTLVWDRPLHPELDTAVRIDVASGAGTALAVLDAPGGVPALEVRAAHPGTWAERVEVVSAPGRRSATTNRPGPAGPAATPVVATAGFVVGDEVEVRQEIAGVETTETVVVARVDAAERVLWWDGGLPATIDPVAPMSLEASSLTLAVLERGRAVETWPDLSLRPEHPRFVESVLAGSARVRATALATAWPVPARVRLLGGRDGTAALTTADLLGDELADDGHGVAALLGVEEPAVLAVPDLVGVPTDPVVHVTPPRDPCDPCTPDAPPDVVEAVVVEAGARFTTEEVVAAQRELVERCERHAERVVLLDPPAADGAPTFADLRAWAARFSSSYAVAVVPWLTVLDPLDDRDAGAPGSGGRRSATRRVPASGHLAGLVAQTDAASGPWLAPANRTLRWAHGVDVELDEEAHAIANEAGMLAIRALPGRGVVPMGARTLSADRLWVFLTVRRTMIYLRRTLRTHLAWVVFEPNGPRLAALVHQAAATLLRQVWEAGGLAGEADSSYAVHVDQSEAALGRFVLLVGVALARPAELVLLRVARTDNRLEVTEAPEVLSLEAV